MLNVIITIVLLLVVLMIIVAIHEGGHFLAARIFGVRVMEFMAGLPGPSIGHKSKKSGTRFGITAIPLGGYCRIAGMEAGEENPYLAQAAAYLYQRGSVTTAEALDAEDELGYELEDALYVLSEWGSCVRKKLRGRRREYRYLVPEGPTWQQGEAHPLLDPEAFIDAERQVTYRSLPCWKRLVILFAGPFANLIFAIVVVAVVLMITGVLVTSSTISTVVDGSPAAQVGIQPGSQVTKVDGIGVTGYTDFQMAMSLKSPGDSIEIAWVDKEGQRHEGTLKLAEAEDGRAILGVTFAYEVVRPGPVKACVEACSYIWLTAKYVAMLFRPSHTTEILDQSVSLVGIAYETKQAADMGLLVFIYFIALLSISIGIMNLLPIPPLDGGKIIIEIYQRIFRRYASQSAINILTTIGIVFVLFLFIYCTVNDVQNFIIQP